MRSSLPESENESEFAQSCLSLCNLMDYVVHGILQARILEGVGFPFSKNLAKKGIKPRSPTLQADSLPVELQAKPLSLWPIFKPIPPALESSLNHWTTSEVPGV